ncbi:protein SMG7L-like [Chenopodium quinoa]|uniref:Protein SMG7L n=1 Tax=Chenopodium quinoa TaxID=63459 RepID=A0A803LLI3_CHEQI|nr:protein SMG7L-like [Chenopodium quinoa]XP_021726464.1 protein SMG7L-like [Chenopodium quinoa]XP_021726465.1 protein SMG7L-like [Chenopodium quinoa]XP_021726466.1 protein SMG7L-like [Chenopodium quinoa]XP_021726467.1 protein SMG7L-like [Chenopodium quinoa]
MPTDSLKNRREIRNCLVEVSDAEKRLWACFQSKGVLHNDAKDLYHKACCIYEKLFLNNNELPDLQNVEYLLWRLHYKHIDEFRKIISQNLAKSEDKRAVTSQKKVANKDIVDAHMEGFKSFLSKATKFYQDLIRKIKRFYGLYDEPWFYKNDRSAGRIEQTELHKCQFLSHRLCICLGDLARYQELYEKPTIQQRNWSVAASYYLEAAMIYPDGGNPQNQLAVLATYIGDEFLALYHCIRSLAVKEPFQDALQNLMLLFERNRSIDMDSKSNEVYDFSKPSEWISSPSKAASANATSLYNTTPKVTEHNKSMPADAWNLIIRTYSFFFLESSLESFLSTFNSTLRELEPLLALDVSELSSALESYRNMNLSKAGPYRALHIISVLIFIIHNLAEAPEKKIIKPKNEMQQSGLVKLALTVAFTFMGRFVDRCLKGSPVIYFPLLPAVLVFVEWLVGAADKVDVNDEKCDSSRRYFFGSFVDLLSQLQQNRAQNTFPDHIALWEDYELRGFVPLLHTHNSLDFSSHWEEEINYKMRNEYRAYRIVKSAIKIAKEPAGCSRKWLFYDDVSRSFSAIEAKSAVEEEEDIVFKPITRRNSEPIQKEPKTEASDECLRRASSLLVAQNRELFNSTSSSSNFFPSSSNQATQNEYHSSTINSISEGPIAAGPPSLSSWVLNGEKKSNERTKGRDANRSILDPIEEAVASDELMRSLSLSTSDSSGPASPVSCPPPCSTPTPPAPLLPSNAVWFINAATHQPVNFSSHPPDGPQASPGLPCFIDNSSPWSRPQDPKLVNHNLPWFPNHAMQDQYTASRDFNSYHGSETSSFGLFDSWRCNNSWGSAGTMNVDGGPPLFLPSSSLLHGLQDHHQRANPYVSPGIADNRPEPQPLLQYLKEREWQLQQNSPFIGSPYMHK